MIGIMPDILYFKEFCSASVQLRETELAKSEEEIHRLTSSTEAKIDK